MGSIALDRQVVASRITSEGNEVAELFGSEGCGNAKTPKAAAKYIENFVKERQ